jgi:zinc protease
MSYEQVATFEGDKTLAEGESLEILGLDNFGIPTFWVPNEGTPAAGLVFKVGPGTEPITYRGLTHIVEHAVGLAVGNPPHASGLPHHFDIANFSKVGSADELSSFLSLVSWTLSSPPLDQVDDARKEVDAEGQTFRIGARERILQLRHGLMGRGANSIPEYGIRKSGHRLILNWCAANFMRSNAALWISGEPPERADLRLLSNPVSRSNYGVLNVPAPGAIHGEPGEVALSYLCSRNEAARFATWIVGNRATSELCGVRKISSYVSVDWDDVDRNRAEVVIAANCAPGRDDEVARVLIAAIESTLTHLPTIDDVEAYKRHALAQFAGVENAPRLAYGAAVNYVRALRIESREELVANLGQLSADSLRVAVTELLSTLLLVAAPGCAVIDERFRLVADWAGEKMSGVTVRPSKFSDRRSRELIVNNVGLTLQENGHLTTVRFSQCGLMLISASNRSRDLISENGSRLLIRSDDWKDGDDLIAILDQEIPVEKRIVMDRFTPAPHEGVGDRRLTPRD